LVDRNRISIHAPEEDIPVIYQAVQIRTQQCS
jgi:hypothetical protein